jgi:tetratricopeptide (TPR) repeat protein
VVAHICEGLGYLAVGDFPASIKSFEQAVAVAADPFYSQWAKFFLALIYLFNKQVEEAEKTLREVLTYSDEFGCEMVINIMKIYLGYRLNFKRQHVKRD